jgi:hypothetical protein
MVPHQVRQLAESLERLLVVVDLGVFSFLQRFLEQQRRVPHDLLTPPFIERALSPPFVERALIQWSLQGRLEYHIKELLGTAKLFTAFNSISWLGKMTERQHARISLILDQFFPYWKWLAKWRPNMNRIERWEMGKISETQKKKLTPFFHLDGPDTIHQQHEALRLAEPQCYDMLNLHTRTPHVVEEVLDLLYRCHLLGPRALDVFIHFCADNPISDDGLSAIEEIVRAGNSAYCISYCDNVLCFLDALRPQDNLSRQVGTLIGVLSKMESMKLPQSLQPQLENLAMQIPGIMERVQQKFCNQLQSGTGDYWGMSIRDLSDAILKATSLHDHLGNEFLHELRSFPSRLALDAIFKCLEENFKDGGGDSALKKYLLSALGKQGLGQAEADSAMRIAIQEEIKFWQGKPDTGRKDLAKAVGKLNGMRYPQYTSWLLVMLKEDDLCVSEVTHILNSASKERVLAYANYLAPRRAKDQLLDRAWLLLFASLIEDQGPNFLQDLAGTMPFDEWTEPIANIRSLAESVRTELPEFGVGLTQQQLSWWDTLAANRDSVKILLSNQERRMRTRWLYFPTSPTQLTRLFEDLKCTGEYSVFFSKITLFLESEGRNLDAICNSIEAVKHLSAFGLVVCKRLFSFQENVRRGAWHEQCLGVQFSAWLHSQRLTRRDHRALELIRAVMPYRYQGNSMSSQAYSDLKARLCGNYETLVDRATALEKLRMKLRSERPTQVASALSALGIENSNHQGRSQFADVPEEIADAVEIVGKQEYEICFVLTGVGELQRQARGIPQGARMLIVRIRLGSSPAFCVHFSPNHEGSGRHNLCLVSTASGPPDTPICDTPPSLFAYYVQRQLYAILRTNTPARRASIFQSLLKPQNPRSNSMRQNFSRAHQDTSLQGIHTAITKLIDKAPSVCLICGSSMQCKLWKPAACGRACSVSLRSAPLEVRLHNLLIDPHAIDLILTSLFTLAVDANADTFLPHFPLPVAQLQLIINSFPPLTTLQSAKDLAEAIRGTDQYGSSRESLLSYLCLRFRGLILTAPNGSKVPSMGTGVHQFLLVNSSQERELEFSNHYNSTNSSSVVFHGTQIARIFPILCEGLRIANGGLRLNGAMYGPGVYCGDDAALSLSYSGTTGPSWTNSSFGNMKVLLGCELAPLTAPTHTNTHVVTDDSRLLVRYVFLLPMTWSAPPKHHVEPAMATVYSMLRTGLQN